MRRTRYLAALSVVVLWAAVAPAQDHADERPQPQPAIPSAGLWPTPRMIDLFIDRLVEEDLAKTYNLDEDQVYNTKEVIKQRMPAWLNANRGEITQLSNEYIEALLGGEAPDPTYVAHWAQRALPVLSGFAEQFEGVAEDMRGFLTEDQQVTMDGQLAAFRVAMGFVSQTVGTWSEGGFDPESHWIYNPSARQKQREREVQMRKAMDTAKRDAMGEPPAEPEAPVATTPPGVLATRPHATSAPAQDEWTRYVEEFIRRFELNEDQKSQAQRILRTVQEDRQRYLRRKGADLADAERFLKSVKSEEQRAAAEKMRSELMRPLDRLFTQLKERLEPIPTTRQRMAALEKEKPQARKDGAPEGSAGGADGKKRESPSSP